MSNLNIILQLSFLTSAVAEIDFEASEYTVREGDGGVVVCVQLVEGHLSWPVSFRLSTVDGSANGKDKRASTLRAIGAGLAGPAGIRPMHTKTLCLCMLARAPLILYQP